jgi:hypothetical protein
MLSGDDPDVRSKNTSKRAIVSHLIEGGIIPESQAAIVIHRRSTSQVLTTAIARELAALGVEQFVWRPLQTK